VFKGARLFNKAHLLPDTVLHHPTDMNVHPPVELFVSIACYQLTTFGGR